MPNNMTRATQPRDESNLTLISGIVRTPPVDYSADPEFNSLSLAPIPPVLGTDVDASRQFYRRGVSQIRMPPLPSQAKIAVGAQAQSQTIITQVTQSGGGSSGSTGLTLSVNNISNPVQNILNLTGSGVSYGPNPGQVSIFAQYQEVEQAGTPVPAEPILNFLFPFTVTDNPGNFSSDIAVSVMVGDSGSGGAKGLVPAPPAGSAAAGKYLKADGTFAIPPGTGGAANYQTVEQAGVSKPTEPVLNFLAGFTAADDPGNTSTDIIFRLGPVFSSTTILASSIVFGSNTSVMSVSVTIPATGGTFRILVDYTLFLSSSNAQNGIDAWISDGTNTWGYREWFFNSGMNGSTLDVAKTSLSPVTYAAGASPVTITLLATNNKSGSTLTAVTGALQGPGASTLKAWVVAST